MGRARRLLSLASNLPGGTNVAGMVVLELPLVSSSVVLRPLRKLFIVCHGWRAVALIPGCRVRPGPNARGSPCPRFTVLGDAAAR